MDLDYQRSLELQIDAGEASAFALYQETSDCLLVIDDLKTRRLATLLKFDFTGTIGVLSKARASKIIPSIRPVLERLAETNFRIDPKIVEILLSKFED